MRNLKFSRIIRDASFSENKLKSKVINQFQKLSRDAIEGAWIVMETVLYLLLIPSLVQVWCILLGIPFLDQLFF